MNDYTISIDESRCIRCGECGKECGRAGTGATGIRIDPRNPACTKCRHCYAVCPKGAIVIKNGAGIPITTGDGMPPIGYEELTGFLAFRRSTRRFLPKEIPEKILGRILATVSHIPSGGRYPGDPPAGLH